MTDSIVRVFNDVEIRQRADQYLDATAMCKAAGKQWNDYWRNKGTQEFTEHLSSETGIPVSLLVEIRKGGIGSEQGTFVHKQVAIHLAQWLSPAFAVQVTAWVLELAEKGTVSLPGTGMVPVSAMTDVAQAIDELRRQVASLANCGRVPVDRYVRPLRSRINERCEGLTQKQKDECSGFVARRMRADGLTILRERNQHAIEFFGEDLPSVDHHIDEFKKRFTVRSKQQEQPTLDFKIRVEIDRAESSAIG